MSIQNGVALFLIYRPESRDRGEELRERWTVGLRQ